MPLLPSLEKLGFKHKESIIYGLLLEYGEQTAGRITVETQFKRPTVYKVLYTLEEKGLVTQHIKEEKIYFRPEPPSKLLELTDTHLKEQERVRTDLSRLLPSLMTSYTSAVDKPVITTFDGPDAWKRAHLAVLAEKKEILAYVLDDSKIDAPLADFWKKYYAIRKRDKIYVRSLTINNPEGIEYKKKDKAQLRETRLVPKDQFPITIEKNIVGNKLVFFSRKEDTYFATIIENDHIAQTERSIFELAWEGAASYNEKLEVRHRLIRSRVTPLKNGA